MWNISKTPEIKTERLILNEIKESDIDDYNEIILDKDRNLWWGYDDVGSLTEKMNRRSFFDIAREDFAEGEALNFAVRIRGNMVGEAVLYNFDGCGAGELGCRIKKDFAGKGYGTEAFEAAADWALASGFLKRVVAKCYRENAESYKMLSKTMEKTGEDETYFYFQKEMEK